MRAFFSNRVLHLLGEIDFSEATRDAMTCMEKGAYFCVSARSPDDFKTALMEWIPGKEQEMARYKDPARSGHDITFVTKDRLLRAVGNALKGMHCTNATEPERVGSPDTHLLILLGRKQGWDFSRGQRRVAQVGVRCEDDDLYGENGERMPYYPARPRPLLQER